MDNNGENTKIKTRLTRWVTRAREHHLIELIKTATENLDGTRTVQIGGGGVVVTGIYRYLDAVGEIYIE